MIGEPHPQNKTAVYRGRQKLSSRALQWWVVFDNKKKIAIYATYVWIIE